MCTSAEYVVKSSVDTFGYKKVSVLTEVIIFI